MTSSSTSLSLNILDALEAVQPHECRCGEGR